MNFESILKLINQYDNEIVNLRRDFHKYAEPGWLEFRTTAKIVEILKENKIKVDYGPRIINKKYIWSYPKDEILENIHRALNQGADPDIIKDMDGFTGAVATIDTGKQGPIVALRFDIDSNNINESLDNNHFPTKEGFRSVNKNSMHACGHDGHGAMGIVTCLVVNEIKERLSGKIKIIFQPGEEGSKGGQSIAESGVLDDVDILLSGHIGMGLKTGEILGLYSGFLASTKFDLCFRGLGSHAASSPEKGRNAIVAASTAILGMYSLCQDGRGISRVNVGTIKGGSGRNVIADKVYLEVETRGSTTEIEQDLYKAALACAEGASNMYGCTYESEIKGYAPNANSDEELLQYIENGVSKIKEINKLIPHDEFSASEDIAYLMKKVQDKGGKAVYMGLGSHIAASHHNDKFDFDENVLLTGVRVYTSILWEILNENK